MPKVHHLTAHRFLNLLEFSGTQGPDLLHAQNPSFDILRFTEEVQCQFRFIQAWTQVFSAAGLIAYVVVVSFRSLFNGITEM